MECHRSFILQSSLAPVFNNNISRQLRWSLQEYPYLVVDSGHTAELIRPDHECRLLIRYPAKEAYTELLKDSNMLTALAAGPILDKCPCILHITGFDDVFNDPAQQHNVSQEDSLSHQFYTAMKILLSSLRAELQRRSEKDGSELPAIAVLVSTADKTKMTEEWKSLFIHEIQLPAEPIAGQHVFGKATRGESLCEMEVSVLFEYIQSQNLGTATARTLIEAYHLHTLTTRNMDTWETALQRGRYQPFHGSVFGSTVSPSRSTAPASPTFEQIKKTIAHLVGQSPGLNTSSTQRPQESKIAEVHWADIGGLDRVRREILDVLELPFKYPGLFHAGCPRRQGVLLYGPPGTGKTLVARAVATECGMSFLSVKGPELLDMYVGESEKNVREVFQKALAAAPCVLFFDEIDSLAPARAKGSGSGGGVMDRMVSQLLTEMDLLAAANATAATALAGISSGHNTLQNGDTQQRLSMRDHDLDGVDAAAALENDQSGKYSGGASDTTKVQGKFVFVIAATNRPDLLDPALLRPGRFDRKIYLGICKDVSARAQILAAQTRKFALAADVDLTAVARALPENVTGADIGAVTAAAYGTALQRKLGELRASAVAAIRSGPNCPKEVRAEGRTATAATSDVSDEDVRHYLNALPEEVLVVHVTQEDLLQAAQVVQPSVTDLSHYEALGEMYDDTKS